MLSVILSANGGGKAAQIIILAAYFLMMIGIAYYSRKRSGSIDEFFLGGKNIGGWMSAFAYGTTYFSAVVFVGYAGKFGWNFGLAGVWIGIGNALIGSFLAWKVLAKKTKEFSSAKNAKTMPEFFEARYLDKRIKLVSSIIIFIFLIPYSASVYQGVGHIFEMIFGVDFYWCVIIMAAVTAAYVFIGGYFATAMTDFLQGFIMLAGVAAMIVIAFVYMSGNGVDLSFSGVFERLAATDKGIFQPLYVEELGLLGSPGFNVIILILLTSFGLWGLPQSIHKFYAVKNDGIKKATVISTVFALIIGGGAYFFGSFSTLIIDGVPSGGFDAIIPAVLQRSMPPVMLGIILVMIVAATMSSLSSVSLSGSSALIIDFYKGFVKKNAEEKRVNLYLRITCLVFIALSAVLAIVKIDAIVTMMSLSWGTLAGCFIGPYVYGLHYKKTTKAAVWTSIIGGLVITFSLIIILGAIAANQTGQTGIGAILKGGISYAPFVGVCAMTFSAVSTPIVSRFTKQYSDKEKQEIFAV
ncbi:MAG: sodium:solute symporter [Clostridiales bacterium]|jgi:SSS family solute:Na+ symporter|nr:sodium:solute symporter [Clostridiales bacterium]